MRAKKETAMEREKDRNERTMQNQTIRLDVELEELELRLAPAGFELKDWGFGV
jgi:hypothetical protein